MIAAEDVIALLEPGPQTTRALADYLDAPIGDVRAALGRLERAEVIKLTGEWTRRRWALAEWEPPKPIPKPPPAPAAPGWWVHYAAPDQREQFAAAARARDAAMQTDKTWGLRSAAFPKDPT
jgi:hypothetical protein